MVSRQSTLAGALSAPLHHLPPAAQPRRASIRWPARCPTCSLALDQQARQAPPITAILAGISPDAST
jgi:hypothetical protein